MHKSHRARKPLAGGRRRKIWTFSLPILSLAALAVVGIAGAVFLSGCPPTGGLPVPPPVVNPTIPIVRVKISQQTGVCRVAVTGAYRVRSRNGLSGLQAKTPYCDVTFSGGYWRFGGSTYPGREIVIEPAAGSCFYVESTGYRGTLHLASQGGDTFIAVNHVDMESYIAGVAPRELMTDWSLETYKALAVAARTFALYTKGTTGVGRDFDVNDNESSQVYGGYTAEATTRNAREAVNATRGMVLGYNGRMFLAQYSACCGGVVNSAYVIRNAPADPPLMGGQACNDCRDCSHYRWGPVRVYKSELYQALLARYPQTLSLGGVSSLAITETTPYGRAVWVDVIGPTGQRMRLRAEDVRLSWNMSLSGKSTASTRRLYSMNCTILANPDSFDFTAGRGFGHGVGLCQWGAQTKAMHGWKFNQILGFYYPGASLLRAY